jgi:cellulose biosynthesis protein BcsQ
MIVAVMTRKGGSGKTTFALNFSAWMSQTQGLSVALLDMDHDDPNTAIWGERRQAAIEGGARGLAPLSVVEWTPADDPSQDHPCFHALIAELYGRHDVIVIDVPGSDGFELQEPLAYAHLVVMPLVPGALDWDSARLTLDLFARARAWRQMTGAPPFDLVGYMSRSWERSQYAAHLRRQVAAYDPELVFARHALKKYDAIARAPGEGMSVGEWAPGSPAARNFSALAHEIYQGFVAEGVEPTGKEAV